MTMFQCMLRLGQLPQTAPLSQSATVQPRQTRCITFSSDRLHAQQHGGQNYFLVSKCGAKCCQFRAPTDCVQYFTGASGNVKSYNFAGGQLLQSQYYQNCIRTEIGYCGIMWKENSISSPDPFQMSASPSTAASSGNPSK